LSEAAGAGQAIGREARANEARSRTAAEAAQRSQADFTEVRTLLKGTRRAMNDAGAASAKMPSILRVIDEITFQTHILALNAAVEAARAGEAGLGFAVVADEVRTLARRCAEVAQQIGGLVNDVAGKSHDTAASLSQFDSLLTQLEGESEGLSQLLDKVNAGSRNQNARLDELSQALQKVDEVTQASAGVAEESAASAAHLEKQALALSDAAESLTKLVGHSGIR
jgi:methyl-accepting chemotaxis protein